MPLWHHRSLSWKTKLHICNASVLSVLRYGAETWPLTKALEKKIDSFDNRALRTLKHQLVPSHPQQRAACANSQARSLPSLSHSLYLLRQVRPSTSHQALLKFNTAVGGSRRSRGRPRMRWMKMIEEDLPEA